MVKLIEVLIKIFEPVIIPIVARVVANMLMKQEIDPKFQEDLNGTLEKVKAESTQEELANASQELQKLLTRL